MMLCIFKQYFLLILRDGPVRARLISAFYILAIPIFAAIYPFFVELQKDKDTYQNLIAIFAILTPLLFNAQASIFSAYQRKWSDPVDHIESIKIMDKNDEKKRFLQAVNINISYLMIISVFSVIVYFYILVSKNNSNIEFSIAIFLFFHFSVVFLQVIVRVHVLFREEYNSN
jgi:cation transporter-like permease